MKINLRKGLFETSSSSEDSLSVYQDMKLYILPTDEYEKFWQDELLVKFNSPNPSISNDMNAIIEANKEILKKYRKDDLEVDEYNIPKRHYLISGIYDELYITYEVWKDILYQHYNDYNMFDYENNGEIIFGFYGYTEE